MGKQEELEVCAAGKLWHSLVQRFTFNPFSSAHVDRRFIFTKQWYEKRVLNFHIHRITELLRLGKTPKITNFEQVQLWTPPRQLNQNLIFGPFQGWWFHTSLGKLLQYLTTLPGKKFLPISSCCIGQIKAFIRLIGTKCRRTSLSAATGALPIPALLTSHARTENSFCLHQKLN